MKIDQELIERLRDLAKRCNDRLAAAELESLCDFHASRLQSLTEEVKRLREALKPFADAYDFYATEEQDNKPDEDHAYASEFNMGDLRRAQAALSSADAQ